MGYKCRDCANFVPIDGTAYGRCKARPFARKQGGRLTDKEFIAERHRVACEVDFVKSEESIPPIIKTCKWCGKTFVVTAKGKREFCCKECRVKWFNEERRKISQEARAKKKCALCGGPLTGKGWKYCPVCAKKMSTPNGGVTTTPGKKQNPLSISEINRRALAEHLSYGEYVMKYGL